MAPTMVAILLLSVVASLVRSQETDGLGTSSTGITQGEETAPEVKSTVIPPTVDTTCGANRATGLFCYDRTQIGVCLSEYDNTGTYSFRTLTYSCPQNTVCVRGEGCKRDVALLTTERPFKCTDEGRYPDIHNCQIYHDCFVNEAGPSNFYINTTECENGTIYNVGQGDCSVAPNGFDCFKQKFCRAEMEIGVLVSDSTIFYVCSTEADYPGDLSPEFFKCSVPGQTFNPAVMACAFPSLQWGSLPSAGMLP